MRHALLIDSPERRWLPLADADASTPAHLASDGPPQVAGAVERRGLVVTVTPWAVDAEGSPLPGLARDLFRSLPKPHDVRPTQVHLGPINPHGLEGHRVCDVLSDYASQTRCLLLVTCDEPPRLVNGAQRLAGWGRLFRAQRMRVREVTE